MTNKNEATGTKPKPRCSGSLFKRLVRFAGSLCKVFGHSMFFDTENAAGSSICKRCGHKKPAIEWDRK